MTRYASGTASVDSRTQGVNKLAAKKIVDDQVRVYINTKRASHEYETISRGLVRGHISVPLKGTSQEVQQVIRCWRVCVARPCVHCRSFVPKSAVVFLVFLLSPFFLILQLQIWRRCITWEKQNPTRTDDRATVVKRGMIFFLKKKDVIQNCLQNVTEYGCVSSPSHVRLQSMSSLLLLLTGHVVRSCPLSTAS